MSNLKAVYRNIDQTFLNERVTIKLVSEDPDMKKLLQ